MLDDGKIVSMKFDPDIAKRLVKYHGDPDNSSNFKIGRINHTWIMKGCHPCISNSTPRDRPFSQNYNAIEENRKVDPIEMHNASALLPDAFEAIHKASQCISKEVSSSYHARIGYVSLQSSIPFDNESADHTSIEKEMILNSLVMDKMRFLQQTALLVSHVISRVETSISENTFPDGSMAVSSRFKTDACVEV